MGETEAHLLGIKALKVRGALWADQLLPSSSPPTPTVQGHAVVIQELSYFGAYPSGEFLCFLGGFSRTQGNFPRDRTKSKPCTGGRFFKGNRNLGFPLQGPQLPATCC